MHLNAARGDTANSWNGFRQRPFPTWCMFWALNDVHGYLFTYVSNMPPATRHLLPHSCMMLRMVTLPLLGMQAMGNQWSMQASSCMSQQSGMYTGVKAWPL